MANPHVSLHVNTPKHVTHNMPVESPLQNESSRFFSLQKYAVLFTNCHYKGEQSEERNNNNNKKQALWKTIFSILMTNQIRWGVVLLLPLFIISFRLQFCSISGSIPLISTESTQLKVLIKENPVLCVILCWGNHLKRESSSQNYIDLLIYYW